MPEAYFIRTFDGAKLCCTQTGPADAAPIVLCDGFGCDGFIWRYLRPALSQRYRVISWHYRGHGSSTPPAQPADYTLETMRGDLAAVLQAHRADGAILLGHSLGAQVILEAALTYPQRLRGLVPICGCFGEPLRTMRRAGLAQLLFPLMRRTLLGKNRHLGRRLWRKMLRSRGMRLWAKHFEVNGSRINMADLEGYFEHLAQMDPQVFLQMLGAVQHHTVEKRLHEVRLPTLIVGAEHDSFTPWRLSQQMKRLIPHANLLEIKAGSHVAPLEFPELIGAQVLGFIERTLGPQG
jgi:pimeloyl-ACP methyl ester carboxylesterase